VLEADDEHLVMTVSENEETLKEYPFAFTVKVEYTVVGDKLASKYYITNDSDRVMPFAFGLHPGFNVFTEGGISIDDYKMIFDKDSARQRTLLNEYPDGPEYLPVEFDNGEFKIDNEKIAHFETIILTDVGTHSRLVCEKSSHEIEMEFSDNLPIYCIWKKASPEANYVCLEPWTTTPARWIEEEDLMTRKNMIHLGAKKTEAFFCNFTFKK
jgi:galactose mutarotase-like enzyme